MLVADAPQEVEGEEVDAEVGRPVRQRVVRVAQPRRRRRDLGVLNHLKRGKGRCVISAIHVSFNWPELGEGSINPKVCRTSLKYGPYVHHTFRILSEQECLVAAQSGLNVLQAGK